MASRIGFRRRIMTGWWVNVMRMSNRIMEARETGDVYATHALLSRPLLRKGEHAEIQRLRN
ncbi:MAG: hypothetical protein OXI77_12270 [Chloroflexota bacterium]|nr:hypothetical protein [Chloroflexota bacterium]MDE2909579.1 hypothetical protein [Chloroflexota bacterium]